ncbi:MAG: hypothetical protein ACRD3J_12720, partial [Thermoanaerobaculia bacterium]
ISGKDVNEFPAGVAEYTGGDTANAEIVIADQGDLGYTLTAMGVASGTYELVLQSIDTEHGDVVQERVISGTATAGVATATTSLMIQQVFPPIQPLPDRRRAVKP